MRARKLAAVAMVAMEDMPPPDDMADVFRGDDLDLSRDRDAPEGPIDRLCLACGGDGRAHDGCDHGEIARLDAPSRAVHDALRRLERAAAEHRAAARALRVLVLAEVARGRGDLETAPPPRPEPCPRCLIRDAEEAAASATAEKPARRKPRAGAQQALPFAKV